MGNILTSISDWCGSICGGGSSAADDDKRPTEPPKEDSTKHSDNDAGTSQGSTKKGSGKKQPAPPPPPTRQHKTGGGDADKQPLLPKGGEKSSAGEPTPAVKEDEVDLEVLAWEVDIDETKAETTQDGPPKHLMLKKVKAEKKDRSDHLTMLMLGPTGSGKTTMVDTFLNYQHGVHFDDSRRLFVTSAGMEDSTQTSNDLITLYHLPAFESGPIQQPITIIDTPGFGNTGGMSKDKEQVNKLTSLIEKGLLGKINVCFVVVQGSTVRLAPEEVYQFNSIVKVLEKLEERVEALVTFCDSEDPPGITAIKDTELPIKKCYVFNNMSLRASPSNALAKILWEMGEDSMNELFDSLKKPEIKDADREIPKHKPDEPSEPEVDAKKQKVEAPVKVEDVHTEIVEEPMIVSQSAQQCGVNESTVPKLKEPEEAAPAASGPSVEKLERTTVEVADPGLRHFEIGEADPKAECRTVLLLGPAGSGKTTSVDAFVNFVYDVKFNDNKRLTVLDDDSEKKTTCYSIHQKASGPVPFTLNIIDTQSIESLVEDKDNTHQVEQLKKLLDGPFGAVDAVMVVMQGTVVTVTAAEQHIFSSMKQVMAGRHAGVLFTFCDTDKPVAVEALSQAGLDVAETWPINNMVLSAPRQNVLAKMLWDMGQKSMKSIVSSLQTNAFAKQGD